MAGSTTTLPSGAPIASQMCVVISSVATYRLQFRYSVYALPAATMLQVMNITLRNVVTRAFRVMAQLVKEVSNTGVISESYLQADFTPSGPPSCFDMCRHSGIKDVRIAWVKFVCYTGTSRTTLLTVFALRVRQDKCADSRRETSEVTEMKFSASGRVKAVHDKVSTLEMNVIKKSLSQPAYVLTGTLSDMHPVKLVTMDGKTHHRPIGPYHNVPHPVLYNIHYWSVTNQWTAELILTQSNVRYRLKVLTINHVPLKDIDGTCARRRCKTCEVSEAKCQKLRRRGEKVGMAKGGVKPARCRRQSVKSSDDEAKCQKLRRRGEKVGMAKGEVKPDGRVPSVLVERGGVASNADERSEQLIRGDWCDVVAGLEEATSRRGEKRETVRQDDSARCCGFSPGEDAAAEETPPPAGRSCGTATRRREVRSRAHSSTTGRQTVHYCTLVLDIYGVTGYLCMFKCDVRDVCVTDVWSKGLATGSGAVRCSFSSDVIRLYVMWEVCVGGTRPGSLLRINANYRLSGLERQVYASSSATGCPWLQLYLHHPYFIAAWDMTQNESAESNALPDKSACSSTRAHTCTHCCTGSRLIGCYTSDRSHRSLPNNCRRRNVKVAGRRDAVDREGRPVGDCRHSRPHFPRQGRAAPSPASDLPPGVRLRQPLTITKGPSTIALTLNVAIRKLACLRSTLTGVKIKRTLNGTVSATQYCPLAVCGDAAGPTHVRRHFRPRRATCRRLATSASTRPTLPAIASCLTAVCSLAVASHLEVMEFARWPWCAIVTEASRVGLINCDPIAEVTSLYMYLTYLAPKRIREIFPVSDCCARTAVWLGGRRAGWRSATVARRSEQETSGPRAARGSGDATCRNHSLVQQPTEPFQLEARRVSCVRDAESCRRAAPAVTVTYNFSKAMLQFYFQNVPSPHANKVSVVIEVNMEQLRNEGEGETGYPRENPPTNGIVWHYSHFRKSGVLANRSATAGPQSLENYRRAECQRTAFLRTHQCNDILQVKQLYKPARWHYCPATCRTAVRQSAMVTCSLIGSPANKELVFFFQHAVANEIYVPFPESSVVDEKRGTRYEHMEAATGELHSLSVLVSGCSRNKRLIHLCILRHSVVALCSRSANTSDVKEVSLRGSCLRAKHSRSANVFPATGPALPPSAPTWRASGTGSHRLADCSPEIVFLTFTEGDVAARSTLYTLDGQTERRGSVKGDTATRIKSPIATKRKALNWLAVFSSHCVFLWDFQCSSLSVAIGCCLLENALSYLTGPFIIWQHRHGFYVIHVQAVNSLHNVIQRIKTGCLMKGVLDLDAFSRLVRQDVGAYHAKVLVPPPRLTRRKHTLNGYARFWKLALCLIGYRELRVSTVNKRDACYLNWQYSDKVAAPWLLDISYVYPHVNRVCMRPNVDRTRSVFRAPLPSHVAVVEFRENISISRQVIFQDTAGSFAYLCCLNCFLKRVNCLHTNHVGAMPMLPNSEGAGQIGKCLLMLTATNGNIQTAFECLWC
ncbi:hypothetical protein PR048_008802 [Dryococelus australis]|uniref:Uncharacterized protein n=1 Tax=Dryococelus australis TaxID=614101 RepID=A0ABQ9HY59_9NEOP|nr:hypothetical protein PR048_008802 [Dryococelus australis]